MNLRLLRERCTDNKPKLQPLFPTGPHLTLADSEADRAEVRNAQHMDTQENFCPINNSNIYKVSGRAFN